MLPEQFDEHHHIRYTRHHYVSCKLSLFFEGQIMKATLLFSLFTVALVSLTSGCASTSSTAADPLKGVDNAHADLSRYRVASVIAFTIAPTNKIDASVGAEFAENIARRLKIDFGPIFEEVRSDQSSGREDELLVTGVIKSYQPGSKFGRLMLMGVGAASFKADLQLKNAADGKILFSAPIDKLWAWGGALGMSKGISDMTDESAAAAANTIARLRGWAPPPRSPPPR